jgi:hypothetical protein
MRNNWGYRMKQTILTIIAAADEFVILVQSTRLCARCVRVRLQCPTAPHAGRRDGHMD